MLEIFWKNFFNKKDIGELKYVKDCPLFSQLTKKELNFVQKILHKRVYTNGEVIFKPSSGTGMFIILKGQVNILHGSPDSQEEASLVSSLTSGDFFGELSLLQNHAYHTMFAQSANNSQLLAFYQSDLQLILKNQPLTGIKILTQLCTILGHRLKKAEEKIIQIHSQKK